MNKILIAIIWNGIREGKSGDGMKLGNLEVDGWAKEEKVEMNAKQFDVEKQMDDD